MLRVISIVLSLALPAFTFGAEPVIDNERITVWDTSDVLSPAVHDFVAVSLSNPGTALLGHKGEIPGKSGERTVVIDLKDHPVQPIGNTSGYPLAFPRPHAHKLFENGQVVVWSYVWHPGRPTPMHFHDKDALVVFEGDGVLKSTTPDGKFTDNIYQFGDIRFNKRDRVHTELLISGKQRAVITELK